MRRARTTLLAASLLVMGACAVAQAATTPSGSSAAAKPHVLPFMSDAYTRAVAEARARKVPLFVEAWAPW